ncbi:hypothetical protein GCM10022220_23760 [Actinocatenispora rupis]|uniref:Uncharacterized protein n=1 Tax=Actinocatenispora rupis TaxID=519421 RepID=A0A8J3J5D1_9ACTN|nr:hypothetical protein Aru02nite_28000 [Actinocatenispora rupis]
MSFRRDGTLHTHASRIARRHAPLTAGPHGVPYRPETVGTKRKYARGTLAAEVGGGSVGAGTGATRERARQADEDRAPDRRCGRPAPPATATPIPVSARGMPCRGDAFPAGFPSVAT